MSFTDKQTTLVNKLQTDVPKEKVKAHLQVLGVFFHLLDTLAGTSKPGNVEATVDEFFQRSTYRLQVWLEQVIKTDGEEDFEKKALQDHELPPLDVALALHSYMLSPLRYFEDSELRFPQLKRMKEYPLANILNVLDPTGRGYDELKCLTAAKYWENKTQLEFNAIDSMSKDDTRVIECPSCNAVASVPWNGDRGFASPGFAYDCSKCHLAVNHDLLCAGKFFKALTQAKDDPGFCLPNTAILVRGELDIQSRCASIVAQVWKCLEGDKGEIQSLKDLAESAANEGSSTMAYIANKLSRADALRAESLPILLRAFEHSYPFTQDVVVALHHQRPFIDTIYNQGWSASKADVPSDSDLNEAYMLYVDFLNLVLHITRREPGWQDDLIWHTHQLMPQNYRAFIVDHLHVYLDHLPKGEDMNAFRHHYDNEKNPKSVAVWIESSSIVALTTKGTFLPDDTPAPESCQAGLAAPSFLLSEPATAIFASN
ncbi:hypothetical protein EYR36_002920 [Pleurotus pulmonarius]|nr:hypothetical protein EYR36_002920 [Pleurotus pulmonarius]